LTIFCTKTLDTNIGVSLLVVIERAKTTDIGRIPINEMPTIFKCVFE